MDPGVRSHGMKANPPEYLRSKYECFLISGWWDILHLSCFNVKHWSNATNGTKLLTNKQTNEWTFEQKDENYIPLGIIAGGIIKRAITLIELAPSPFSKKKMFILWISRCLQSLMKFHHCLFQILRKNQNVADRLRITKGNNSKRIGP